jgi:hypothetical protein
MKVDWKNWNWGGKTIFLCAIGAVASQFFAWVDIGFASQNGFEQGAFLFLLFWLYPVIKLLKGKPSMKWLSLILSILSVISVLVYMEDKTISFMGMTKNASGMGAVVFLLSSIGLLVGAAGYKAIGIQSPSTVEAEDLGAFKFTCPNCGQHLNAEQEHIGQTLDCPACSGQIIVPTPAIRPKPLLTAAPKKKKTGWVIGGVAGAIALALIAVIGSSGGPTFDKADPEGSSDRMAASVSEEKRMQFAMAFMSLGLQAESESQLNEALHGKTVDQVIAMAKSDEKTDDASSTETELVSQDDVRPAQPASHNEAAAEPRPQPSHQKDQEPESHARATNPTAQKALAKVGSIIATGDLEVTVSSLTVREELGDGGFFEARASKGGVYLVADWTYKNATRRPMSSFSNPTIRLISPDRIEYNADVGATSARASEIEVDEKIISNLNPGITVQSTAVFEVSRELLSELGWQIQIKYDGAQALYDVDSIGLLGLRPQPVAIADSTPSDPDRPAGSVAAPTDNLKVKLAELKGELAEVDAKMNTERTRYQTSIDTINRLTNFKRTPVREGSPEYYRCLEASKVIQDVEAGAGELKAKKVQLEATIKALEE